MSDDTHDVLWELALSAEPYAVTIAKKFLGRGLDMDDLMSEARIGLFRAARTYRPELSTFLNHCTLWVKRELQIATLRQGKVIKLPTDARKLLPVFYRTRSAIQNQEGREPTRAEVIARTGLESDAKELLAFILKASDRQSDAVFEFSQEAVCIDPEPDGYEFGPAIDEVWKVLPSEQRTVLRMLYGFETGQRMTFKEVADTFGKPVYWVHNRRSMALRAARNTLRGLVRNGRVIDQWGHTA